MAEALYSESAEAILQQVMQSSPILRQYRHAGPAAAKPELTQKTFTPRLTRPKARNQVIHNDIRQLLGYISQSTKHDPLKSPRVPNGIAKTTVHPRSRNSTLGSTAALCHQSQTSLQNWLMRSLPQNAHTQP